MMYLVPWYPILHPEMSSFLKTRELVKTEPMFLQKGMDIGLKEQSRT